MAGTSARADASKVVMSSGGTPQVTIALNSSGRGTTKSVAVGPESVESLDLTLGGGFTPKAGDTINLASGKRVEVFVFSSLKDPTGKTVSGFFDLGRRTKIQGGFGVEGRDAAPFEQHLFERGVIVRPMGGYGLGESVRISVGSRAENQRLLDALP